MSNSSILPLLVTHDFESLGCFFSYIFHPTMLDKSPWDTDVMLRIICVIDLKFEKALLSFKKKRCCPPPPPPPTDTCQNSRDKSWVCVSIIAGGGWGSAVVVAFIHDCLVCAKTSLKVENVPILLGMLAVLRS